MGPISLALSLLLAPQAPSAPAAPPALSWDEARSLAQKLAQLQQLERQAAPRGKRAPSPVVVTEGELNSYLNLSLASKMPAGLADVRLALDQDRVAARAVVDLEKVRARADTGRWSPLSYLSGRVPLEVKGRYRHGREGFGSLEVEQILLASFPVPVSLLEQVVSAASRDESRPLDIQAPFRLPYAAKRLRVQKGQARLEF